MVDINKIRKCSYLLPDPGGEVVRELLVEIKRLQAEFTGELTQPPLEKIRAKCEQYWNEPVTLCPEELHVILEFIHQLARSAENEIERLQRVISTAASKLETHGGHSVSDSDGAYRILMGEVVKIDENQLATKGFVDTTLCPGCKLLRDKIREQQNEIKQLQAELTGLSILK